MKDHPMFIPAVITINGAALINSFLHWAEFGMRLSILLASFIISLLTLWHKYKQVRSAPRKKQPRVSPSRLPVLLPALLLTGLLCPGCSFLSSTAYDPESGKRQGRVLVYTVFDGQSSLTKLRQSKAGTTIGSLNESSSGTNANSFAAAVVTAAIQAAK